MDYRINLQEIEKKTYLAYRGDGLWDIFAGFFLMSIGFFMIFGVTHLMGVIPATIPPIVLGAKKSFIQPRMGYVRFSPERQAQEQKGPKKLTILTTTTMLAGPVVFMAFNGDADWQKAIRSLRMIPLGIFLTAISAAVGILFGLKRLTVYGALNLVFFIAEHLADSEPPAYFILPGFIIFVVGLVMLIRFVRRTPKNKEEMSYVS